MCPIARYLHIWGVGVKLQLLVGVQMFLYLAIFWDLVSDLQEGPVNGYKCINLDNTLMKLEKQQREKNNLTVQNKYGMNTSMDIFLEEKRHGICMHFLIF